MKKKVLIFIILSAVILLFNAVESLAQYPGTITRPYNYQTDLYTGRFSTSLPIFTAPGRKNFMPQVALTYSSNTSNGIAGIGWSLDVGSTQRNTKFGSVQCDGAPYVLLINGSVQELTHIGNNEYRAKEEGSFWQYKFGGAGVNTWKAWDKEGGCYEFNASLVDPEGRYFASYLTKAVDIDGNYMEISYLKDGRNLQMYPQEIRYTGNQDTGDGAANSVRFYYENRPDVITSYREGFKVITALRLYRIEVYGNNSLARKYVLNYDISPMTKRSILSSIKEYGSDGVTGLPAVTCFYEAGNNYYFTSQWDTGSWLSGFGNNSYTPIMTDVNNDGKTDCLSFENNSGTWRCGLSDGKKFNTPSVCISGFGAGRQPLTGDFNGDGFLDIGYYEPGSKVQIRLGTGNSSSWGAETKWFGSVGNSRTSALTGDFNGDGKTDILFYTQSYGYWHFAFSNGSCFENFVHWKTDGANSTPLLGDFNGDGFTDIGYYTSIGDVYVSLSIAGRGYGAFEKWLSKFYYPYGGSYPSIVDLNADGMSDIVVFNPSNGYWWIGMSKGNGLESPTHWITGFANYKQPIFGDFDADGLADIGYYDSGNGEWVIGLHKGKEPDLLTCLKNGLGGKIDLTYSAISDFDNTGADSISDMGLILPVVSQMTTDDGLGNTTSLNYYYEDGFFNSAAKELRGFGYVRVTDPSSNRKEVWFHQGLELKGRAYKEVIKDSLNRTFQKTESGWNSTSPYNGVYFTYLEKQDIYLYDGDDSCKHTRTNYAYDNWGNVTSYEDLGDYNQNGDEVRTYTEYAYNDSKRLHIYPKRVYVKDALMNIIRQSWYYYDNNANYTDLPIKGLLTKEEHWLEGGDNPCLKYAYDRYGNVVKVTDGKGSSVTTIYDSLTHTFPVSITNTKGQTVTRSYDYRTGAVLTETDGNNQTTRYTYDVFGRALKVIGPDDSEAYPAIEYSYDTNSFPWKMTVSRRINSGQAEVYTTYSFYDGLHRLIQVKTEAEDKNYQIITGQKEFNYKGQVIKKFLPYLTSNTGGSYTQADLSQPHTSYTYDSIGRAESVTAPDGTIASTKYSDWTITNTDAQGKQIQKTYDAYGRTEEVKEFNQGETYTTRYKYDTTGNLIETIDAKGNKVTISYDSLGRKISMQDPDMGEWTYNYDITGNLISQTDAKNQTITFSYDELNRLIQKQADGINVTYTYDDPAAPYSLGRLCKVEDTSGATIFEYDNLGREIRSAKTIDGEQYIVERTYDALNRLTSLTYPDGEVVNYSYNSQGQIEEIASDETNYLSSADYNYNGQLKEIVLGNGTVTKYTYNPQTMLLTHLITTDSHNETIQDLNYSFDNVGNVLGITDNAHNTSQSFSYDDLHRLTTAIGPYGTRSYTYNAIGNITSKDGISYYYSSTKPHAVTDLSDGSNYTYDANGNMQTRHTSDVDLEHLIYNAENRLTAIQDAFQNTITEFYYDGDGGRVKKIQKSKVKNQNEETIYIGSLYEVTDGVVTKHIFKGSTRLASKGRLLGEGEADEAIYYYHGDHLGSSNLLTNGTGEEVKRYEYEPFGTTYFTEGAGDTNYRYTGKELDQATGLYYYGARYYDARLGRFISADPTVQRPYDPQDLNRYSYCRNNPLKYTDPSGYGWSWKKFLNSFAGAFVGAVISVVTLGAGAPLMAALCIGGAVGGAVTGGLEGGVKGAVIGAVTGGALGALGGAGVAAFGAKFATGMLAAGAVTAAVTDRWDSFAGGLAGGVTGTAAGAAYQAAGQPGSQRNQLAQQVNQQKQAKQALGINQKDSKQVQIGARPVKGTPFDHTFVEDKAGNITEMGPGRDSGKNTVFRYNKNDPVSVANAIALGDTPKNTMESVGLGQVEYSYQTQINETMVSNYEGVWSSEPYVGISFNSNYAVKTWVYGSGGEIVGLKESCYPSFSGKY